MLLQAYGKTTYLITNLQLVPRGTEGAVSLEGTLAGLGAAAVYAGLAFGLGQVSSFSCEAVTGHDLPCNYMLCTLCRLHTTILHGIVAASSISYPAVCRALLSLGWF